MPLINKNSFLGLLAGIALTMLTLEIWGNLLQHTVASAAQPQVLRPMMQARLDAASSKSLARPVLPKTPSSLHDHWHVRSLDGKSLSLAQLHGKVVFLNLWNTSCPPCVAEMPGIERLYNSLRGTQVVFLAVAPEDPQRVRNFLAKNPLDVPVYLTDEELPDDLVGRGIPTTLILSPSGTVVFKHTGPLNWDDPDVRAYLRSLAGEQTPSRFR
jgi:thiol-disulfide isomerase/thioredoxin